MQDRRFAWKTRRNGGGAYLVSLTGELDLHASGALGHELLDLVAAGADDIALDLTDVTLLDSTTLALLLRTSRLLRSAGGRARVVGASPHVRKVLELTALERELSYDGAAA